MGMLERGGKVKTAILGGKRDKRQMHQIVRENVVTGAPIMTDEFVNYDGTLERFRAQGYQSP